MAKISAKIDTALADEIDSDRKNKGLKLSEWVALAIDTYLHQKGQDNEIKSEISHLKEVSAELSAARDTAVAESKRQKNTISLLQEEQGRRDTDSNQHKDLSDQLRKERDALNAELTQAGNNHGLLRNERDLLVADLNQYKNASDQLRKDNDALNAELSREKSGTTAHRSERDAVLSELAELKNSYAGLLAERDRLAAEVTVLQSTNDHLTGARDHAESDRNKFLNEREDLEKKVRELMVEAELSKAKNFIIDELRKDKEFLQGEYRKMSDRAPLQLAPPSESFWSWIWGER